MIEGIFSSLPDNFISGEVDEETSFYFSIDETKKTVILTADSCQVKDGKALDKADCICKTDSGFFAKIWNDGYRPGMGDFLGGKIKSNDPLLLKEFLAAFGK